MPHGQSVEVGLVQECVQEGLLRHRAERSLGHRPGMVCSWLGRGGQVGPRGGTSAWQVSVPH